nr:site-specific integrase [Alsobacter soli]
MKKVRGQSVSLPVGEESVTAKIGDVVRISLRTREPKEAKARFLTVSGALCTFWDSVRAGPKPLNHRQRVALAGELYREFVGKHEDDPAAPEVWDLIREVNAKHLVMDAEARDAQAGALGRALMIGQVARLEASLNRRFGRRVDQLLSAKGIVTDQESRSAVLFQVAKALDDAAANLKRKAEGDYSTDPKAARFPEFVPEGSTKAEALTLDGLFELWVTQAQQTKAASAATVRRYRSVFNTFGAYVKGKLASAISPDDMIAYKEHRLAAGTQAKTFKDADLAALKSVFGWAHANRKIPANPAADVTIKVPKKKVEREHGFTEVEADAILSAALTYTRTGKESEFLAKAKRWVPWICALSGARVTEVTSLTKADFRTERGVYSFRVFQGSKNGTYRDVPVHAQLLAMGIREFVAESASGPLFYDAEASGERGAESQSGKLRLWVRSIISDKQVQPNHGWRHRFTTIAREVGMDLEKREYIVGHTMKDVGARYGDMAGLKDELDKLPWYQVGAAPIGVG